MNRTIDSHAQYEPNSYDCHIELCADVSVSVKFGRRRQVAGPKKLAAAAKLFSKIPEKLSFYRQNLLVTFVLVIENYSTQQIIGGAAGSQLYCHIHIHVGESQLDRPKNGHQYVHSSLVANA